MSSLIPNSRAKSNPSASLSDSTTTIPVAFADSTSSSPHHIQATITWAQSFQQSTSSLLSPLHLSVHSTCNSSTASKAPLVTSPSYLWHYLWCYSPLPHTSLFHVLTLTQVLSGLGSFHILLAAPSSWPTFPQCLDPSHPWRFKHHLLRSSLTPLSKVDPTPHQYSP